MGSGGQARDEQLMDGQKLFIYRVPITSFTNQNAIRISWIVCKWMFNNGGRLLLEQHFSRYFRALWSSHCARTSCNSSSTTFRKKKKWGERASLLMLQLFEGASVIPINKRWEALMINTAWTVCSRAANVTEPAWLTDSTQPTVVA